MCLWAIYIYPGLVHIFPCSRIGRLILDMYKSLTDIQYEWNWETEHYNSVLEITVSFLGIHIGFTTALHFQCGQGWSRFPRLMLVPCPHPARPLVAVPILKLCVVNSPRTVQVPECNPRVQYQSRYSMYFRNFIISWSIPLSRRVSEIINLH